MRRLPPRYTSSDPRLPTEASFEMVGLWNCSLGIKARLQLSVLKCEIWVHPSGLSKRFDSKHNNIETNLSVHVHIVLKLIYSESLMSINDNAVLNCYGKVSGYKIKGFL